MTAPPLTAEQRAVVEDRGGSLLVSAGAGSGKTSVLVERVVAAVEAGELALHQLLAITFTEKAAGELRDRIRARFAERGDAARARDAEGAWISTIHGFCARVLRSHALLAGLDPHFRVLDPPESARLSREAFDDALGDFVEAEGGPALDLVAAYTAGRLARAIPAIHDRLRTRGQEVPALPARAMPPPPETERQALRAARAAAAAELGSGRAELASVREGLATLERCAGLLEDEPEAVPQPGRLAGVALTNGRASELSREACEAYREALEAWSSACADYHATAAYRLLGVLLDRYAERLAARKRARSALDFDDLELGALRLLRDRPEVRGRYAGRFALVLVDEFQDTNPLQAAIVELLDRGNVVTVGDPLQSIYGFRHADVEVMRARRDALAAQGRAASLTLTFRSDPELVTALNAALGPVLGDTFQRLAPGREASPSPDPRVELLVTDTVGWDAEALAAPAGAQAWRVAEARLLAQRVAELVEEGWRPGDVVVLLRATGDMGLYERELQVRGLPAHAVGGRGYWSQREVADLLAWLRVLANPRDELALYEVLASPLAGVSADGLALVSAAARERQVPVWEALAAVGDPAGADAPAATVALAALAPGDAQRIARLRDRARSERALAPRLGVEALLDRALGAGYELELLAMPGGERRMANVRKLMRVAREREGAGPGDLRAFLDDVGGRAGEAWVGDGEAEAPVEGEDLDAVRLLTIHRAKGLEFPVVCLADLGRTVPAGRDDLLLVGDEGEVGLKLMTLAGGPATPALDHARLCEERKRREAEEERRLLWVAATRARERLILSGASDWANWPEVRPGGAPIAWLAPAFAPGLREALSEERPRADLELEGPGGTARVRCALNAPATVGHVLGTAAPPVVPAAPEPVQEALPPALAPLPAPQAWPVAALSYSSLQAYARCPYRFYVERVLRVPLVAGPPADAEAEADAGLPARVRGTLVHELLEELDLAAPAAPGAAAVREAGARHGASISEADVEEVRALIDGFARSETCARLARARDVRREAGFAFALASGGPGPLVTGAVDVLAREPDGMLVVDYKSDRLEGEAPAALVERAYRTQRVVYALAALRAGAPAVEVVHLLLEAPADPVAVRFDAAAVPDLEAELAGLAEGVREERFPVADVPHRELCGTCPARGTLCSWPEALTLRAPPADEAS